MALRSLSLCSGVGGLDLGLAGIAEPVRYVEGEAYAAATLVARMEEGYLAKAPIWSDLRTYDAGECRGLVDLVVGGYPCQPFSYAGSRKGAEDPRHLWPHVFRVYQESEARFLFCENVRGHLTKGFDQVLEDLAQVGADVRWGVFSSRGMGAPHKRERLFFLADSYRRGCKEERGSRVLDQVGKTLWNDSHRPSRPPGPEESWRWVPSELWPTQSPLCRGTVGASTWMDRLRALGNSVDPVVAREAFRWLSTRR